MLVLEYVVGDEVVGIPFALHEKCRRHSAVQTVISSSREVLNSLAA